LPLISSKVVFVEMVCFQGYVVGYFCSQVFSFSCQASTTLSIFYAQCLVDRVIHSTICLHSTSKSYSYLLVSVHFHLPVIYEDESTVTRYFNVNQRESIVHRFLISVVTFSFLHIFSFFFAVSYYFVVLFLALAFVVLEKW
uniref:Ovule protein n=1 Tax=Toxocara canis TaxID=6265 RepID=A0A183U3K1_TOXCA